MKPINTDKGVVAEVEPTYGCIGYSYVERGIITGNLRRMTMWIVRDLYGICQHCVCTEVK